MEFPLYVLIATAFLVSSRGQDEKSDYFDLFPTARTCIQHFDVRESRCVSKVYCNRVLSLGWVKNSLNGKGLNCSNTYEFDGESLGEIEYAFININDLNILENTFAQSIVSTLDLSYNNFAVTPIIPCMERLKLLNLSRNDLTEAELYNIHQLQSLSEIDLSHNKINRILINQNFYVFKQLKTINLSNNHLVVLENGIFDSFPKLETLDLSFNYIENLNILIFEGVKDLLNLNLKHNELSDLNLSLVRFSKLEKLDLSVNKIQNVQSADFEKLTKLTEIYLNSNSITQIEETALDKITEIKIINLSNNLLESVPNRTWGSLSKLMSINLSKNYLKSMPVELFKDKHITEFSVSENKLEGALSKYIFKGLNLNDNLDLSNQELTSVEDFAFDGLENLKNLLLNGNKIQSISNKSFSTLRRLEVLDLSNNLLTNIEFNKHDLVNLQSLLLQRNRLQQIKHDYFYGLNKLEFLDISNNNITQVESSSFKSLTELINLQIRNNPIRGTLEINTFDGLKSLPDLDISGTFLTTISNGSFNGMNQMKKLNASHSKIYEMEYDSFLNTGLVEIIDLSYNKLTDFNVNATGLTKLNTLILNNNLLLKLSPTFKDLRPLTRIVLSYNQIETVDEETFGELKEMSFLDLSFNKKLKLNTLQLEKASSLVTVILSGIHDNITFGSVTNVKWSYLELTHLNICNVSSVRLNYFANLNTLVLNNNNISKIEVSAFQGVKKLTILDLSFNSISFIQSGAFKDNMLLSHLNVSHNMLKAVSYGIFRGLSYLNTVDMSYNEISDLQSERFYEVQSLRELIVDHNKINNLNADEFFGTNLEKLSIGENPISCDIIVNMKKANPSFAVTAIRLDDSSADENVDGITCNIDTSVSQTKHNSDRLPSDKSLEGIKEILSNLSIYIGSKSNEILQENITKTIDEGNSNLGLLLKNISSVNVDTNNIMAKILSAISMLQKTDVSISPLSKQGTSAYQTETAQVFYKENKTPDTSILLKICVGLMLVMVMLVSTILFLMYRSGLFFRNRQIRARRLSDIKEHTSLQL